MRVVRVLVESVGAQSARLRELGPHPEGSGKASRPLAQR